MKDRLPPQQVIVFQMDTVAMQNESHRRARGCSTARLGYLWLTFFALMGLGSAVAEVRSINGTINFDSNFDGVPEAVLNSTGFGIGTTAPSTNLHLSGNAIVSGSMVVGGTANASGSNLYISGTMGVSVQTVSGNTTLSANSVVLADTSAGNIWLYLPSPSSASGRTYLVKKTSNSHSLYLNGGSGLIDGMGQLSVEGSSTGGYPYMQVINSGNAWYVIATSSTGGGNSLWTPATINTQAWYDAAETGAITSSAGNISKWADKSGKGVDLHVTVGDGLGLPQTGTDSIGGHNMVTFIGGTLSKNLNSTGTSPFYPAITDAAFFMVANVKTIGTSPPNGQSAQNRLISLNGAIPVTRRWYMGCPYGGQITLTCGTASGNEIAVASTLSANQNILMGGYCSVSDNVQKIWLDGNEIASDTTGHSVTVDASDTITLAGIYINGLVDHCSIGECIIINGTVSQATREKIEGYLAHKWRLAANLPGGHPYKSAPPAN